MVGRLRASILLIALAMTVLACGSASAQAVDLQLVLAVDTSGSVSEARFELQKQGYVAAFRSPQLLRAIASGSKQAIAVTMVQWTGPTLQIQVVPWTQIRDEASMHAFADAVAAVPRRLFGGGTSISGAIDHAMMLFQTSDLKGARRVIDVSGDGTNNRGRSVTQARDEAVAAGATINGLPILALEPELDQYYQNNVVGGPGAFVVPAQSYETFAEAVLKKLVIEIADVPECRAWCGRHAQARDSSLRMRPSVSSIMASVTSRCVQARTRPPSRLSETPSARKRAMSSAADSPAPPGSKNTRFVSGSSTAIPGI